jgi:hydrogenase-1 operon protein HyaE
MTSPLIAALSERHGIPTVDEHSIDAFLIPAAGEPDYTLLFFSGDPVERSEALDVAVVLPQLASAFVGRLRAGLIARSAENQLRGRFKVHAVPSLVLAQGGRPIAAMPKIRDWSDYVETIENGLSGDVPRDAQEVGAVVDKNGASA